MTDCVFPRRYLRTLIGLLALVVTGNLYAQCDPPDLLPEPDCDMAPLICMTGACYSTQTDPPPDPVSGFCGPMTALHNPQYILFQVTTLPVDIAITVNSCAGPGCGLQSAIVNVPAGVDCQDWGVGDVVVCDPGSNVGETMALSTDQLELDSFYLLVIDGCAGQICQWTIDFASGVYEPQLPTDVELTNGDGDTPVCPGQDSYNAQVGPTIPGVAGYLWSGFPWGDQTTTNPLISTEIPENATPGIYNICVVAFTGCDTTDIPVCFPLEILPVPMGISPPETLCVEDYDIGYVWGNQTIFSPGAYNETFADAQGCISDSTKEFFQHPVPDVGVVDTLQCNVPPFEYEGMQYDQPGTYDLFYQDGSIYGCDSMATLDVAFAYIEGDIVLDCDYGDWILSVETFNTYPQGQDPLYYWTDNGGNFISDEDEVIVTQPGTYHVDLIMEVNGMQCVFPATSLSFTAEEILPDVPSLDNVTLTACESQIIEYCVEDAGFDILEYVWTIPGDATIFDGEGTRCIEIDWLGSNGGQVCVALMNHCGEGEQVCFDVEVVEEPLPMIDIDLSGCVGEVMEISAGGTGSANTEYYWDYGTATIVSGGTTGAGPHEIQFANTGLKVITLQAYTPGCDTVIVTEEIIIEALGLPVINCETTTNSVTFTWNQVPGAAGYSVNEVTGPAGVSLNDTTYQVTGLSNGQTVTVEVVVQGSGACPDQTIEHSCSAQDCMAPAFNINAITPQCEDDPNQILELIVEGSPASGTWSGPGIVDPATGEFSPGTAGAGSHQVSVVFDDGMCQFNWPVTIVVNQQPTSGFTATAAICESETVMVEYTGTADPGATYFWDFDTGIIVSGTGQGPYEIRWNNEGNYTISLYVEENGCVSDTTSHAVQVDPLLGTPSIQCNTSTSSITFTWMDVANADTYTVTVLNGEPGVRNGNQFDVTGLTPGDSTTLVVTASGPGLCPSTADTITCYAQDCPSPVINLVPTDTSLCLNEGPGVFNIQAEVTGGSGTGSWSGTGITDTDLGTFDANVAGDGLHIITYTYVDQGCMFTREAMIDVNSAPTAVITDDDFILTCDNGNRMGLDGTMSTATNGTPLFLWSSMDGVILSRNDSAGVLIGAPGTYQLLVSDPVSGCVDSTNVAVMQDDGVPTADAGADQVLNCDILMVSLGGQSSSGPDIHYRWSSVEGNILTDPTQQFIQVDMPGSYQIVVVDSANGCQSVDEAIVSQNLDLPGILVSADGILTCDMQSVQVSSELIGGSGTFTYLWTTNDGTIQSDPTAASITVISPGTYQLNVVDQLSLCEDSIDIEVMADADVISSLSVDVADPRCFGEANGYVTINQVNGGSPPYIYSWTSGSMDNSSQNLSGGVEGVTVTDNNGCSFVQQFTLVEPELVTANVGDDIKVNVDDSVRVTLETSLDLGAIDSTIWGGLVMPCSPCLTVDFIAQMSGQVTVTVVDTNGCTASDALVVQVDQPKGVFAPNVFSPNDDGDNDFFTIYGPSVQQVEKLTIFDRWGNVLYEQPDITPGEQGWDGTFNGEPMMPGVYVYYAKIVHDDGFDEEKIGDITLVR